MSERAAQCLKPLWPPVRPFNCLWVCVGPHNHPDACARFHSEWVSFLDLNRWLEERDNGKSV